MTGAATIRRPPMTSEAPGAENPLLSVITVFWNGRDDAPAFVDSLATCRQELGFPMEVIAVDNASTDGTSELIASEAPWIRLIRNEANAGFAAGCNEGLRAARGEFFLLLNPDCEANAEALTALVEVLSSRRRIGMASCRLLNADGSRQFNHYPEPGAICYLVTHSLAAPFFQGLRRLLAMDDESTLIQTDWVMGAVLATRREVVERIGLMEESYFLYAEDTDWCRRARDAGYAVVVAPDTAIRHRQGTSSRKRAEFTFRKLFRSLIRYGGMHLTPFPRFMLSAAMMVDMIVRLPIYLMQGRRDRVASAWFVLTMIASQDPDLKAMEEVTEVPTAPQPPRG